jgi:beta-fructofuranosidase
LVYNEIVQPTEYDLLDLADARRRAALERVHNDHDYPVWHIAAPVGRLNDPNGLVYWHGRYHVFYQWGPYVPEAKAVYWGHAVSADLIHWQHVEPAIAPERWYDKDGCYSGSAVAFGDHVTCLYTGNVKDPSGARHAYQCAFDMTEGGGAKNGVAVRGEAGRSLSAQKADDALPIWRCEKWPDNPVIPVIPGGYTAHFRDPMVFGRPGDSFSASPDAAYRMCLGAQRANESGAIALFSSPNLRDWRFDGELQFAGPDAEELADFGFMWECPNIFTLKDEVSGRERTVALWCPQGLRRDGERFQNTFQCGYVIGDLDGNVLRNCTRFRELDGGTEFYAPQCFAGPDGSMLLIGWAGNAGEDGLPSLTSAGWLHSLTLPRKLTLHGKVVRQNPAPTPECFGAQFEISADGLPKDGELLPLGGQRAWRLQFITQYDEQAMIRIEAGRCSLDMHFEGGTITLDRSQTLYQGAGEQTSAIRIATFAPDWRSGDAVVVDCIFDHSVLEIYLNGGEVALTSRVFLGEDALKVFCTADGHPMPNDMTCTLPR